MKALRFLIACILLCSVAPVAAQETMDATTLRQHMIIAEGKPPDSYVETINVSSVGSGDYIQREFHRGLDYKTIYGSEPFGFQSGRFEGREWDTDRNGLTTLHEPLIGAERLEKQVVTIQRVHAPFEAWKVSTLNVRGEGDVQLIDASTFQLRRKDDVHATSREITEYDDFKSVAGFTFPAHWIKSDDKKQKTEEGRVTSFESTQVSDANLAIPASRNVIAFPPSAEPVELPTTFYQFRSTVMHHRSGRLTHGFPTGVPYVIVHATLGTRAVDFLLDSGSERIVLDSEVVKGLGLARQGGLALVPEIRIGNLSMRGVVTHVGHVDWTLGNDTGDTHVVGFLGFDFIRSVGLTIDYRNRRVTVVPPGSLQPPTMTPESDVLAIRLAKHVPTTSASINGSIADQVIVDTAGSSLFILFDFFERRYPEALRPEVAVRLNGTRAAAKMDAEAVRLREVQIGRYHLTNYDAFEMLSERDYPIDCDGVIGPSFLQHFTVGFDYAGGKMYLVHNEGQ